MMMRAICSVKGISSQKPSPQASTTSAGLAGVMVIAATTTTAVNTSAKIDTTAIATMNGCAVFMGRILPK
jgi:hypothetical protein